MVTRRQPDADELVLAGQVQSAVKVEGLDGVGVGPEEVLHAPVRGQVGEVARVLGDLDVPGPGGHLRHRPQGEGQVVAAVGCVDVHVLTRVDAADGGRGDAAGVGHDELVDQALGGWEGGYGGQKFARGHSCCQMKCEFNGKVGG